MSTGLKWGLLALAGVIAFLLIHFVPGVKFWERNDAVQTDEIATLNQKLKEAQTQLSEERKINYLSTQSTALARAGEKATIPTVTLRVQALPLAEQQRIIGDYLLRHNYLKAGDTARVEATAIALTVCDTIMVHDTLYRVEYADTGVRLALAQDSLKAYARKERRMREIASKKGLFTGRNPQLRDEAKRGIEL
ncbi:hypothetical protein [Spirosoma foliorum]|uniref:Uncharacterized protein n=1 Tax=Spirosoma foliorum TaxID=2710596 RepID=A0A7G5H2L2_9BACT|nr:hypothetical protein [Spirosoma foliorum]QMW05354.1 hypothetical protein H3H32_10915 [Spirosoma foliorum]